MAVPRIFSQSRALLARGSVSSRVASSVFLSARIVAARRQFTSSTWVLQDIAANDMSGAGSAFPPAAGSPQSSNERSLVILKLPKRLVRQEIEAVLNKAGFQVKRIQLRLDRFTFYNDTLCFVELGDAKQVNAAIDLLNGKSSLGDSLIARPLNPDFVWGVNGTTNKDSSRFFFQSVSGMAEAVQPMLDDRRIYVQALGWGEGGIGNRRRESLAVIERHFAQFGIETVSNPTPDPGDRVVSPRVLCWIDFKTKEGAEKAVAALNGQNIEGQAVRLDGAGAIPAWRAWQLSKLDRSLLQKLQKAGKANDRVFDKLDKNAKSYGKRQKKKVLKSAALN